ncbi:MAG: ABC transporter substrate-binding protein [Candidatus Sumerlaeia bacterium]|nr:ABC transporter substrate-binding protein [Candidatus Sumerlaeia bacterium]
MRVLFSLLLTLFILVGSALPAESAEKVVRLGYFPNVTHAQALIGVREGRFAKALEGKAKLETVPFNAGPSVIEAIFAGHLDVAYIGPSPTLNGFFKSKGAEIRVVGGAASNGVMIVGNKSMGIDSLEDLRTARVATPQLGNTQDVAAKFFLQDRLGYTLGTDPNVLRVIPIANPDVEILFEKNQLEAAWVPEPWASRLVESGLANRIAMEHDFWDQKVFTLTGIIARVDFLEKHPELLNVILKVNKEITNELQEDPAQFVTVLNEQIKELTGKSLPDNVIKSSLRNVVFDSSIDKTTYTEYTKMASSLGLIVTDGVSIDQLFWNQQDEEVINSSTASINSTSLIISLGFLILFSVLTLFTTRGTTVFFFLGLLSLWQTVFELHIAPAYLFPSPFQAVRSLYTLLFDGKLVESVAQSMLRMFVGYGFSVIAGISIGALIAFSVKAKQTLGVLTMALQSLPSICWLPFALLWVGLNEQAIIAVIILGATFSIAVSTESAFRNVPPIYARVGKTLGAKNYLLAKDVLFFAALPELLGGLKVGWTFAWRSLMAAELIRSDIVGVGHLLEVGRQFNDVSQMLAAILIILAIGILVDRGIFSTLEHTVRRRWGLEK